jgi:hypothetical protein
MHPIWAENSGIKIISVMVVIDQNLYSLSLQKCIQKAHPASNFLVALVHTSSLPTANGKPSVLFLRRKEKND